MNRNEWRLAACVLVLAIGVSVGRAQEKPTPPVPIPTPKIPYIPPPAPPFFPSYVTGLEAVGCKACIDAVQAIEAKCKSCTDCAGCGKCAETTKESFASGCGAECVPAKKVKKSKKTGSKDHFLIAFPPPAPPMSMAPQAVPIAIYAPAPIGTCPMSVACPVPAPPALTMVFRASGHAGASACGEHGCESGVKHAKYESTGKIAIDLNFGLARVHMPVKREAAGELEVECGPGCRATCKDMTLHLPGGKQFTIATAGKQVVITGPSLKASCDSLTRTDTNGSLCLHLHGHVRLHQGKDGMRTDIESDQVELVLMDGMVEVHTVTRP